MIRTEAAPVTLEAQDDDFCFSRDEFVAVLQHRENAYRYSVRDLRGERPTIHGVGSDFPQALSNVTRLLDALTGATE